MARRGVHLTKVLQGPVLNGDVHTEEAEEMTAGNSLALEQNSSENNLVNEENGHGHSNENHSSEKIKFIVSEEDDEFTDAIETTSNGLFSRDNLDINRLTKQPTHLSDYGIGETKQMHVLWFRFH